MKRFLKFSAFFVSGFILGGAIVGYFSISYANKTIKREVGDFTLVQMANDISLLESYRNNEADRFFKVIEDGIPENVLLIDKSDEMKKSYGNQVLKSAKYFYACTKTSVPKNIETIIEKVELSSDLPCNQK